MTQSGVHSSLHTNCRHQITYVKFNLNVIYLPPYETEVLHYKLAKTDCIHRAIVIINWEEVFHNVDSKKQEMLFNEIVLNIISNFISHKTLTFDNRDPPSITRRIKK